MADTKKQPQMVPPVPSKTVTPAPTVAKRDYPFKRGSTYFIEFNGQTLELPSVTTILGDTIPKQKMLVPWAAKQAAAAALAEPWMSVEEAAAAAYRKRDNAVGIGKTVHSLAEAYGNGATLDVDNLPLEIQPYGRAFQEFISVHQPKILFTEVTVFNVTHGYAGTADQIGVTRDGNTTIFDYKTGKNTYKESHLQQMAYANAEYIYTKDHRVIPMPKIGAQYLVHLKANGRHNLISVEEPFEDFLQLLRIHPLMKKLQEW